MLGCPLIVVLHLHFFNGPVVHFYRNVWTAVPSGKVKQVAAMLKAIHAQEDREAAKEKARQVVAKLRGMKLRDAAELVSAGVEETLSYYEFPREHRRCPACW